MRNLVSILSITINKSFFLSILAILFIFTKGYALEYSSITLKNGLEAYFVKTNNPIITHVIAYSVGSIDEESSKEGIAHLLEHSMFLGTHRYSKSKLDQLTKKLSASYNAYTSHDSTLYYMSLPKSNLEEIIKIESDRMQWLLLDSKAVENEKSVINEERRMGKNSPYQTFYELLNANSFPTTNYGRSIIGYVENFNKISNKDIKKFYKRWYVPNNAKVFIIGDIDIVRAKSLVKKYYGNINVCRDCDFSRPSYIEQEYQSNIIMEYKDKRINQELLVKSYLATSFVIDSSNGKKESLSLFLLYKILGTNAGRLYKELVLDKKIAVDVGVNYDFIRKGSSAFAIYLLPREGISMDRAQKELDIALSNIEKIGFSEKEVRLAHRAFRNEMEFLQESSFEYIMFLAKSSNVGVPVNETMQLDKKFNDISAKDVNNEYSKLLRGKYIIGKALKE